MGISEKKHGLRKKLIIFVTILALTTYTTSALFIYIVQPQFFPNMEPFWFTVITFGMGIFWSAVLAEAFQLMLLNLRAIVEQIETNFEKTASTVETLSGETNIAAR